MRKIEESAMGVLQRAPFFPKEHSDFRASGSVYDFGKSRRRPGETPPPLSPGRRRSKTGPDAKNQIAPLERTERAEGLP